MRERALLEPVKHIGVGGTYLFCFTPGEEGSARALGPFSASFLTVLLGLALGRPLGKGFFTGGRAWCEGTASGS